MSAAPLRRSTLVRGARRLLAALGLSAALLPAMGAAADGPACRTVRLADIGWTDTTATTALFSHLVRELGYQPAITVLSLPVTYASLKNRTSTCSSATGCRRRRPTASPTSTTSSVDVIGANLEGAKYTLAVPHYT